MFLLLLIAILLLWAIMPDPVQAAPLLADAHPVMGYLGIFVTFAVLIALGILLGKRDRPKVKADLIPPSKAKPQQKSLYRIKETRVVDGDKVLSVFTVEQRHEWSDSGLHGMAWASISDEFTHLAAAEAHLVRHLQLMKELTGPKLTHEYFRDGTPVPPAPPLSFP